MHRWAEGSGIHEVRCVIARFVRWSELLTRRYCSLGHVFCDACINDVIKRAGRGNSANCPTCQKELKGECDPFILPSVYPLFFHCRHPAYFLRPSSAVSIYPILCMKLT